MTARQPACTECGERLAQTSVGRDRVVIALHCLRCQPQMTARIKAIIVAAPVPARVRLTARAVHKPTVGDSSQNLAGASAPVPLEWDDNRWG